jgi:TPR repeat protein
MVLFHVDASDLSNTGLVDRQWHDASQDEYLLKSFFKVELEALSGIDQKKFQKIKDLLFLSAKTLNSKVMFDLIEYTKTHKEFFTQNMVSLYIKAVEPKNPKNPGETRDPLALSNLGFIYDYGLGVREDKKKAIRFYKKASKRRCTIAQYNLAKAYELEKNLEKALKWYQLAAEKGFAPAQYILGSAFRDGKFGLQPDLQEAFNYFLLSATQGDRSGQNAIGLMYEDGLGVQQDIEKAIALYVRAAEHGSEAAKEALVRLGN